MSEIEALLELYGALDRAVVDGEADAADLAPLLRPYAHGAAGWYEKKFLPWLAEAEERAENRRRDEAEAKTAPTLAHTDGPDYAAEVVPEADAEDFPRADDVRPSLRPRAQEVSDALGAFAARPIEGRMGARRLLAVAAAALAMPEHFGHGGSHADIAQAPLIFQHPDLAGDPVGRSKQLHERLANTFTEMSGATWRQVVESSVADGSLPPSFAIQAGAPPCTGRLIMRPGPDGTDSDPCTVLEAEFITEKNEVSFEEAKNYLEPSNWVYPGSLWCRMEKVEPPLPSTSWVYHETVATSCPPTSAWWTVSTDLRFWFSHPTINEARVEYDFPPGGPAPGGDIEVDEGSLRIIELPDGRVHVITTKRVRFAGAFDGAGLAMFMCATGYTSALEDMVFSVSKSPNPQPFPVQSPQGGNVSPQPNPKKTTSTSAAATPSDAGAETLDDVVKETAEFVASAVKDVADTCTSSLKQIQAGNYKVENAWSDGIKMWSTYVTNMTKALDLGTRAVKASAKNSPQAGGTPSTYET